MPRKEGVRIRQGDTDYVIAPDPELAFEVIREVAKGWRCGFLRNAARSKLAKGRVYLYPGEKAPEWADVKTSPRGARYYEGKARSKKEEPKEKNKPEPKKKPEPKDVRPDFVLEYNAAVKKRRELNARRQELWVRRIKLGKEGEGATAALRNIEAELVKAYDEDRANNEIIWEHKRNVMKWREEQRPETEHLREARKLAWQAVHESDPHKKAELRRRAGEEYKTAELGRVARGEKLLPPELRDMVKTAQGLLNWPMEVEHVAVGGRSFAQYEDFTKTIRFSPRCVEILKSMRRREARDAQGNPGGIYPERETMFFATTILHELGHSINPIDMDTYHTAVGKVLEEGLTELAAWSLSKQFAREITGRDVKWGEDRRPEDMRDIGDKYGMWARKVADYARLAAGEDEKGLPYFITKWKFYDNPRERPRRISMDILQGAIKQRFNKSMSQSEIADRFPKSWEALHLAIRGVSPLRGVLASTFMDEAAQQRLKLKKAHGDEWSELDDPDQDIHPKNVGVRVGIPSYIAQAEGAAESSEEIEPVTTEETEGIPPSEKIKPSEEIEEPTVEKHLPGKHNQKDHGPDGGGAEGEIERAPAHIPDMDRRRKEAVARIKAWQDAGKTVDYIIKEGYRWRKFTRRVLEPEFLAWDWAVWEQIQALAKEHGYEYKDELTAEDVFNDPTLPDPEGTLDDPKYQRADHKSDIPITDYRNTNNPRKLLQFLKSKDGVVWRGMSLRSLWRGVKFNEGKTASGGGSFGADRHFKEFAPFPGMAGLLKAGSWKEALDTEVTVYRGVRNPEHGEARAGKPVVSYTTSPQIARLFAEGYYYNHNNPGQGGVYERKIKFGDILGYLNPDGEYEVLLTPPKHKVEKLFKGAPTEPMDSRAHTGNAPETTTGIMTTNQGVAGSQDVQDSRNAPITLAEIAHAEMLMRLAAMGINKMKTNAASDLPSRLDKRGKRRWPSPLERVNQEIGRTKKAMEAATRALWRDEIGLDAWHNQVRAAIDDLYGKSAFASVLRLKEAPDARARARDNLLVELRHQHHYLDGFRNDLASGRVKTEKQAVWRARLYGEGAGGLYNQTVSEGLPQMKAYWHMTLTAAHCNTCLQMAKDSPWPSNRLPRLPRDGSTDCRGNCKCWLSYRRAAPRHKVIRRKKKAEKS